MLKKCFKSYLLVEFLLNTSLPILTSSLRQFRCLPAMEGNLRQIRPRGPPQHRGHHSKFRHPLRVAFYFSHSQLAQIFGATIASSLFRHPFCCQMAVELNIVHFNDRQLKKIFDKRQQMIFIIIQHKYSNPSLFTDLILAVAGQNTRKNDRNITKSFKCGSEY